MFGKVNLATKHRGRFLIEQPVKFQRQLKNFQAPKCIWSMYYYIQVGTQYQCVLCILFRQLLKCQHSSSYPFAIMLLFLNVSCTTNKLVQPTCVLLNYGMFLFIFTYFFSARHGLTNNDSSRGRWMFKKKKSERYRPNRNSNNGAAANSNGAGNNTNLNSATNSDDNERNCMLNHVSNSFCCLCSTPNYVQTTTSSDGSEPRPGSGPSNFQGLGSKFGEGPRLGIGPGLIFQGSTHH